MRKLHRNAILLSACAAAILFFQCSLSPVQTAGGSSDTEISKTIIGSVVDVNGKPVSNAMIFFNSIDSEDNMTPVSQGADTAHAHAQPVMTDANGLFKIGNVKTGKYAIEVNSGDSLAVILYCTFDSVDTVKHLPVDTLKPMVFISGTILPNGPSVTTIVIDGLNRPMKIDSAGKFTIKVPAGKHTVKFSQHGPNGKAGIFLPYLEPGAALDIGYIDPSMQIPQPCGDSVCDFNAVSLMLRDMGLGSVAVESVAAFKNGRISTIKLRGQRLHFLSPEIARLTALETLDIGANQFHAPLQAVTSCLSLTVLRLDSNFIPYVGNSIGSMLNLKELDLSNNEISSLPISITSLTPAILKLDNNRLLDIDGPAAQWADTYEPNWRQTQRSGGQPPVKDFETINH
jgi:hypothetical protein